MMQRDKRFYPNDLKSIFDPDLFLFYLSRLEIIEKRKVLWYSLNKENRVWVRIKCHVQNAKKPKQPNAKANGSFGLSWNGKGEEKCIIKSSFCFIILH